MGKPTDLHHGTSSPKRTHCSNDRLGLGLFLKLFSSLVAPGEALSSKPPFQTPSQTQDLGEGEGFGDVQKGKSRKEVARDGRRGEILLRKVARGLGRPFGGNRLPKYPCRNPPPPSEVIKRVGLI